MVFMEHTICLEINLDAPDGMFAARQGLVVETRASCNQPDQVCLSPDKAVEQGVPTF